MPAWTAPGGWRVEPISVVRDGHTRRVYRVSRHGVFLFECATVDELAAHGVPIGELVEED